MQRSVRRTELESNQFSPSPSPQPELLARLKSLHDLDFIDTQPAAQEEIADERDVEDELAFNLFAPTKTSGLQEDVKIRLRSPTPDTKDPGFIQSERTPQYYTANSTDKQQESFLNAAVSGNQIMRLSTLKWSGMAYPWKILHLKQSSLSKSLKSGADTTMLHTSDDTTTKRRRKGKQARVKLRRRHAAAKLEEAEKKAAMEAKEAALQATKTRKNREKKQRQRARDRAKKAASNNDVTNTTDEVVTG